VINKTNFGAKMELIFGMALISTIILISATIVSNVNAADNNPTQGYSCEHIPGSGTIGQVYCCELLPDGGYCTTCDNTQPPSNCGPREPYGGKEEPNNFDPNNGAVFHDEGSNDSKNINPKNLGDNVFNDGSSSSEKNNINPDKIIGGDFNQ